MSRQAREDSTPARNTRARSNTPLPGLATKQSHAYGAQGKTNLHTQVRSGGSFAEDFTAEISRAASPAKKVGLRQRAARQPAEDPILESGDEAEEDAPAPVVEPVDPGRVQTALAQGLGYLGNGAAGRGAGMVHAVPEPSWWRVSFRTLPRWTRLLVLSADGWLQLLLDLCHGLVVFFLLGGIVYAWLPLPERWQRIRFQHFWAFGLLFGIPGYDRPPDAATDLWYRARHDIMLGEIVPSHNMPEIQWAINLNVLERLRRGELGEEAINKTLGLHGETLEYLQRILPATIVLDDAEEQGYRISPEFFQALAQRVAQGGDDVAPLWDSFVSSNEQQIQDLSFRAASRIIDDAVAEKQLVSSLDFAQALQRQNAELAERWTQEYSTMWQQNFETVRDISRQTTEETMQRFTTDSMVRRQLDVLTKAVDLQNTYDALRTYNWFTYGEGAIINPHLTSATAEQSTTGWISSLFGMFGPLSFTQNPPATVLLPWTEVTDCWCAAPAQDGSAQISMLTAEPLYPDRLILEHIPAGGTRRIANAPRMIEIWADLGSASEAARLQEVMEETIPYPSTKECTKRPSDTHICLARDEYDIHRHNHVQSFPIWTNAESIGLAVTSFTIRIVNNWGGQRTCIYRMRMIGDAIDEGKEGTIGGI